MSINNSDYVRNVRVSVLVDVQNVFYGARDLYSGKLDFSILLKKAVGSRSLVRAIAYCVSCPKSDPSAFHGSLRQHGFDVKEKMLQSIPGGGTKGNWDVGIAIDAVLLGQTCDVIILVTGDGDFVDLVNYLKTTGKRVEVVCFRGMTATDLLNASDEYTWVDKSMLLATPEQPSTVPEICV